MTTVVHLITGLQTGGAETMLAKLVEAGDRGRVRNVVVSMTAGGAIADRIRNADIEVVTLGMSPGRPGPLGLIRLVALLRRLHPHVLQTWLHHADLLGTVAAGLAGVPSLAWNLRCSDMGSGNHGWIANRLPALLAGLSRRPAVVVVNSSAGRRWHEAAGYRPRRWELIPNGFDTTVFRPDGSARARLRAELAIEEDHVLIAMAARFDAMKDHGTFLNAAAHLATERPGLRFVLAGRGVDGMNRDLTDLCGRYGIAEQATLIGDRRDMPELLAACDIVALSSAYGEGFPNVIGEAMACGVPCVGTDVGDVATIIGDTGRVVVPRDGAALAAAWRELVDLGPPGRRALGERARARIESNFSLSAIAARYETLYRELAQDFRKA